MLKHGSRSETEVFMFRTRSANHKFTIKDKLLFHFLIQALGDLPTAGDSKSKHSILNITDNLQRIRAHNCKTAVPAHTTIFGFPTLKVCKRGTEPESRSLRAWKSGYSEHQHNIQSRSIPSQIIHEMISKLLILSSFENFMEVYLLCPELGTSPFVIVILCMWRESRNLAFS